MLVRGDELAAPEDVQRIAQIVNLGQVRGDQDNASPGPQKGPQSRTRARLPGRQHARYLESRHIKVIYRGGDQLAALLADSGQRAVRPVLIVVGLVVSQDPPQMGLVPDNGVVQELAPTSADPAFGYRVAPHRQLHLIRVIGTDASG